MQYSKLMLAVVLGALGMNMAGAVPTAEEAAELGKSLTPLGAIKAGNKEGTIPEWTGGICTPPAGYKPVKGSKVGGAPYINPYANEKPLFRITAADVAKYEDKLDEGAKELFRRYPQTYFINVYPTHRSACFPNYVYENTVKKVMNPRIIGGGVPSLVNAHAQVPFPIPKTGLEVMWNVTTKPVMPNTLADYSTWIIDSSGRAIPTVDQMVDSQNVYWDISQTSVPDDTPFKTMVATIHAPAGQVGGAQLRYGYLRQDLKGAPAWSYSPGQRRVRQAPEFSYDGVSTTSGGKLLFDEIDGFDGRMDRFDFKLVGRKEMYVPYNAYDFVSLPPTKTNTPNHIDMNSFRFELHRVWVVEADLKPGERHVQKKKVFYIDEDTWNTLTYNGFDHAGKLHHMMLWPATQHYDSPLFRTTEYILYDFPSRAYLHGNKYIGEGVDGEFYGFSVKRFSPNYFSPENMAGRGVR